MKRARVKSRPQKKAGKTVKQPAGKKKKSKIRRFFKWLGITLGTLLACLIIALGFGFGNAGDPFIPVDHESGKINVLLMGVDNEGLRTDAMMVVSYNFDNGMVNLLSIPRDTKVYVTNRNVYRKVNEVHAMHGEDGEILGPVGSSEVVTQLTGIPINYYIEFSFTAIDNFMNILGPVTYDVPDVEGNGRGMNYDDPAQDLHIHLKPGVQELTGNQVQQFLRYRKSNDGTTDGSDISRIARQQDFVKAVIDQKVNIGLLMKLPEIFRQMSKELKTNVSVGDVARYARYLTDLKGENIKTYQLPGEDQYIGGGWYYVMDEDAAKEMISQVFGYDASDITTDVTVTGIKPSANTKKATSTPAATKKPAASDQSTTSKTTVKPTKTPVPDEEEEEPTRRPTAKPTVEPTEEPTERPTAKPTAKPTEEPTEKPTEKPTAKPTAEPEPEEDDVITLD